MNAPAERDYVLGTGDEEIDRLGLQHRIWRPRVLDCWQRAGIGPGSRVLDVGCGPGYATFDLAELVGPDGAVEAVERSAPFARAARARLAAAGLANARVHELDLMNDPLPGAAFDASWCRWVCCFVSSPRTLVEKLALSIRPGGVAIFHEYADYQSWRLLPRSEPFEEFVRFTMTSWRETGGEPDIALKLPPLLERAGFRVRSATPHAVCVRPGDHFWHWPASYIQNGLKRLVELGRGDEAWAEGVRAAWAAAEADPASLVLTPLVLEIVAEKIG